MPQTGAAAGAGAEAGMNCSSSRSFGPSSSSRASPSPPAARVRFRDGVSSALESSMGSSAGENATCVPLGAPRRRGSARLGLDGRDRGGALALRHERLLQLRLPKHGELLLLEPLLEVRGEAVVGVGAQEVRDLHLAQLLPVGVVDVHHVPVHLGIHVLEDLRLRLAGGVLRGILPTHRGDGLQRLQVLRQVNVLRSPVTSALVLRPLDLGSQDLDGALAHDALAPFEAGADGLEAGRVEQVVQVLQQGVVGLQGRARALQLVHDGGRLDARVQAVVLGHFGRQLFKQPFWRQNAP
eukprot:scaffold359_cov351-Pinguiococcus_pyrenoidosus.AAC.11